MFLKESELILNPDGSIYHLCLKPEHIANTVILVGDPDRVEKITKHFDQIEFTIQNREFKTQTGVYNGKRITVLSTGIGSDNIDIVLNELDALVNIDFNTRMVKEHLTSLDIIRIGTSGALQEDIPIDSFLISTHGLDLSGMLQHYQTTSINNKDIENAFISFSNWDTNKATPLLITCSNKLLNQFNGNNIYNGITATAGGFYAPQGRSLRLSPKNLKMNNFLQEFSFGNLRITNLEMETAAIYGLSKLLGHQAISLNAILANRATAEFSKTPHETINSLINYTLKIV